jgi:hypothetical protein
MKFGLSKETNKTIKLFTLLFMNFLLLSTVLLKHYLENELWFFGTIIIITIFILNIVCSSFFIIRFKKMKLLLPFIVPVVSVILLLNNVDEKIAIKIELGKAKNELAKIIKDDNYKRKSVYRENGLYAFVYKIGLVDNWSAIIYDNSGILEEGINIIENNELYMKNENYGKIKELFGGDLYLIKKIEEDWYLCSFT